MNVEKTIASLQHRGYSVQHFATGAEVADYLAAKLQNTDVGIGGCMTAKEIELDKKLTKQGNRVHWHWLDGPSAIAAANAAPIYVTSANAIAETGEIVNIDGTGNRLAGQVYGKKMLYVIASTNKICPDLMAAIDRAHNVAAVKNCKRFDKKTPCKVDDKCHHCVTANPESICRAMLILEAPVNNMTAEVILIDEELGY